MEHEVSAASSASGPGLAGWHGNFYLRDPNDYFRVYPKGRMHLDFHSFFGPGVNGKHGVSAADGGNALKNRFFVRRLRIELAGEFLKRWSFNMGVEFGGQPIGNANGKTETAAGKAGEDPTADSARWAALQTAGASASLADAYINYSVCPCLNFMLGQFNAPITMENRTSNNSLPWIERNIAVRGFIIPTNKEIGLMVWGELGEKNLNYEVGVFSGDGQNRPQVDNAVDFIGRVYARPFAQKGGKGVLDKATIGVGARHGERDQAFIGYSYPAITSGQGFALWDPRYTDSKGQRVSVIPSGGQNTIGGELRLPFSIVEVRGEAYYVANHTREAIEGYQLTNTERLGTVKGIGWYGQISAWPLGDAYVNSDPGFQRPTKVDFAKDPGKPKKGLEVLAIVAGINADYSGASRDSAPDAKTPGAPGATSRISIFQYGFGATYWHTRHIRASVNYTLYHTPGSGPAESNNLASVPGNLSKHAETQEGAHMLHELSTRLGLMF
jgi:hypothetical protein